MLPAHTKKCKHAFLLYFFQTYTYIHTSTYTHVILELLLMTWRSQKDFYRYFYFIQSILLRALLGEVRHIEWKKRYTEHNVALWREKVLIRKDRTKSRDTLDTGLRGQSDCFEAMLYNGICNLRRVFCWLECAFHVSYQVFFFIKIIYLIIQLFF